MDDSQWAGLVILCILALLSLGASAWATFDKVTIECFGYVVIIALWGCSLILTSIAVAAILTEVLT